MTRKTCVQGLILTPTGLTKGFIVYTNTGISEWGVGDCRHPANQTGLITPLFVNCHTHIGDSFLWSRRDTFPRSVDELVAPPDGLKHKALENATEQDILRGMNASLQRMHKTGTEMFWDFRENGVHGVSLIRRCLQTYRMQSCILARPSGLEYNPEEIDVLLHQSEGIGISGMQEWSVDDLHAIRRHTKQKKKLFALHASEIKREDCTTLISLQPDFVVHMTQGTHQDFILLKDHNIPVVICPQSNRFFGLHPPLKQMKKAGVTLLLGTDNAMLVQPDIINEVSMLLQTGVFSLEEVLQMITYAPRKALNSKPCIHFPTSTSSFVILEPQSLHIKKVVRFEQDGT